MGLFKNKSEIAVVSTDEVSISWPDDALTEVDDDAFAEAIAAGRMLEAERDLIVSV
jgi:hypothetical protein